MPSQTPSSNDQTTPIDNTQTDSGTSSDPIPSGSQQSSEIKTSGDQNTPPSNHENPTPDPAVPPPPDTQ